jgi:hypothetical protein
MRGGAGCWFSLSKIAGSRPSPQIGQKMKKKKRKKKKEIMFLRILSYN